MNFSATLGKRESVGDQSDGALMMQAVTSPASFLGIYERHASTLYRFFVRRVGADVGEDLLGELFRIAFERRAAFDPSRENALPWLYGIAANLVRHHRRSEARRLRAVARIKDQRPATPATSPVGALESKEALDQLADVLVDLPDGERDVLLLVAFEELSYDATASALGIPVGTVRSRLNRARSRMRELLADRGQDARDPSTRRVEGRRP